VLVHGGFVDGSGWQGVYDLLGADGYRVSVVQNPTLTEPAWRTKASWYLVTTGDLMIPPGAQRTMSERIGASVVEVDASHAVYVSQPAAVADLIKQAAAATVAKEPATVA
jgi:hypothetical protein